MNPIVPALALAVSLVVIGIFVSLTAESQTIPPLPATPLAACVMTNEDREKIRAIALRAFDEALQNHVEGLFEVWMKDSSDQPKRARSGWQAVLSAYNRARSDALKWNPPLC